MNLDDDRRSGVRVNFNTEILVTVTPGGKSYQCSSRDISLRGIFLNTDDNLEPDTKCDIEVRLKGGGEDLRLFLTGHVVRKEEDGYAVYFDSVDLDSYTHLKNIVKYNSPDKGT